VASDTQFAASHFPIDENSSYYLLITDAAGVAPTVTVYFYDDRTGTRKNSIRRILRLHGSIGINVEEYLDEPGLIILSSDSDGIVSRYWRIYQNGKLALGGKVAGSGVALGSGFLRKPPRQKATGFIGVSEGKGDISTRSAESQLHGHLWKRSVSSYPLQLLKKRRQFCIPYDFTESSSSYIIASDVSLEHESSGSIIELYLYSQNGKLLTALRKEIGNQETVNFKLNDYLDGNKIDVIASESRVEILANKGNNSKLVGESDTNQAQARSVIFSPLLSPPSSLHIEYRKTGKAVLKVIEGNIICTYAQFLPEIAGKPDLKSGFQSSGFIAANRKAMGFSGILSIVPVDCVLTDTMEKTSDNLLYFNLLDSRAETEKELIITDAYGYGPAIQIDFLDNPSNVLAKIRKLLPPHGTISLNLLDYIKLRTESESDSLSNGMIKIQSHIPIIANYKNPPILLPSIRDTGENLAVGWYSPSDNLQISLLATNTGIESVKAQATLYDECGAIGESKELYLKPKIVSAWQIAKHFKQGQLGSIKLHSDSKDLSFLCVGIDKNTKQVLMAIQAQEIMKSDNF